MCSQISARVHSGGAEIQLARPERVNVPASGLGSKRDELGDTM